jgi:hypothetical protein
MPKGKSQKDERQVKWQFFRKNYNVDYVEWGQEIEESFYRIVEKKKA